MKSELTQEDILRLEEELSLSSRGDDFRRRFLAKLGISSRLRTRHQEAQWLAPSTLRLALHDETILETDHLPVMLRSASHMLDGIAPRPAVRARLDVI